MEEQQQSPAITVPDPSGIRPPTPSPQSSYASNHRPAAQHQISDATIGGESVESERDQSLQQIKPGARLTLVRYLQDLHIADTPSSPPKYHTGKVPNSKSGDGKPRLLLMGQKRCAKLLSLPRKFLRINKVLTEAASRRYQASSSTNFRHQTRSTSRPRPRSSVSQCSKSIAAKLWKEILNEDG